MKNFSELKVAVVGFGVMGRRHFDSLKKYGLQEIYLVRRRAAPPKGVAAAGICESLIDLADQVPLDGVIICTPSSLHGRDLMTCLKMGLPVLTEKPVVADMAEAKSVWSLQRSRSRILAAVGYDLRYTPTTLRFFELLTELDLGRPYFCQWDAGGYLPLWRPGRDYRSFYSARRELGGGVALDLSHEVDGMIWYFGLPERVMGRIFRRSDLEIDSDDLAFMFFEYDAPPLTVNITVDYLRRPFTRRLRLVAEKGTLVGDEVAQRIWWHPVAGEGGLIFQANRAEETPFNQEIKNFLECLLSREAAWRGADLVSGLNTVGLVAAAAESHRRGRMISTAPYLFSG